jgi:hypothetical protein
MNQALPTIESNTSVEETDGSASLECAVCPHPWAEHDRIATRFCTATTTENHSRGCVCAKGK